MKSKYVKIVFITVIVLVAIFSITFMRFRPIGPGVQDFSKKLVGNYALIRSSATTIFIAPRDVWSDDDAIIPSIVIRLNEYENYIIAERQGLKRRSPNDSLDTYEIPDDTVKDYWILDTKNKYVLKKLTYKKFQIKMDSLKIPKNIPLVDIYEY